MTGGRPNAFLNRVFAEILDHNNPSLARRHAEVKFARAKRSFAKMGINSSRSLLSTFDRLTPSQQHVAVCVFCHQRYTRHTASVQFVGKEP